MTPTPFNFIAHLKARPGCEQELEDALKDCVAPTRAEPGNVNYDIHRSQDNPAIFVIYEGWKSEDPLDTHFAEPHFKKLIGLADGLVAEHGPDGKPFTSEALTMITEPAPRTE